jgi:hypothetical protein
MRDFIREQPWQSQAASALADRPVLGRLRPAQVRRKGGGPAVEDSPLGVVVAREQANEQAKARFEELLSQVAEGAMNGVILSDSNVHSKEVAPGMLLDGSMRRGVLRGACAGFIVGLVPLTAVMVMGAGAGAFVAKMWQLRLERGTAPRVNLEKLRR